MKKTKKQWISEFRKNAEKELPEAKKKGKKEKRSEFINKKIKGYLESSTKEIIQCAEEEGWTNEEFLGEMLLLTYASYIVMLEYRNKVWPYEYMTFARRIGELWEPFCKITFKYPIRELKIVEPLDFCTVQKNFSKEINDCISDLNISSGNSRLLKYYELLWEVINSNKISLALDLHFEQDGIRYNCDFKSGFSSNEKGNVNRLLLVGCIYKRLIKNEKTLLFVRQEESQNNNYFKTLKQSEYWECYCHDECYKMMEEYTGFDLREWINNNIAWEDDISEELKAHLIKNDLLKYLTW